MEDRIIIIATLELLDNKLCELKEVVIELQDHCLKTEQGMLQYDWYVSESTNTIKVIETYINSKSVLIHFDNCKTFGTRLNKSRAFVSMEVFGNASYALRQRVKKINAPHFTKIATLNKLK